MRLLAFRIKNFRSIVDSGLKYLSPDNITVLIGQNESGKTSVLEALKAFSDGIITDDMLRSDLSLPEVSCLFGLEPAELKKITEIRGISPEVAEIIRKEKEILLVRSWNPDKSSLVRIGGERVEEVYNNRLKDFQKEQDELLKLAGEIDSQHDKIQYGISEHTRNIEQIEKDIKTIDKRINELRKAIQKEKNSERKETYNIELDRITLEKKRLENKLEIDRSQLESFLNQNKEISEKYLYARNVLQAEEKLKSAREHLEHLENEIRKTEAGNPDNPKQARHKEQILKQLREQYTQARKNLDSSRQEAVYSKKLLSNIVKGMNPEQARSNASRETAAFLELLMPEELGEQYMKYVPVFRMFEDFSSLLPNRIDLDDLMGENIQAEGFKAVRNLLIIAGIEPSFFYQQSNRILKQKIENLNGELTVNFQDYWRQNVGKNSKIRIQFELEHYDISHPEKRGKPYLEFWIKDEYERLYPKQRSRGVRWFLSFFLELKASAVTDSQKQILLIDEPGLSLHARAQEDVLKVFEDLKDKLMIIYTTHSPYLVDINKLHRIIAVQRAIETDETSETMLLDVHSLARASADTLSPVYSIMGARISDQQIFSPKNNVIVEDLSAYYYYTAFFKLLEIAEKVSFIPATGPAEVGILANILTGWKLDFIVLTNDTEAGRIIRNELKINLFGNDEIKASRHLLSLENGRSVADLFSTIDFKNHVLHQRVGITESNTEYIFFNDLSPVILAHGFHQNVMNGTIKWDDLDSESRTRISEVAERILELLKK
jgi:predicted ATP-dependent endonuclease of OLD family